MAFSRALTKSSQGSKSPAFPCETERRISPGMFVYKQIVNNTFQNCITVRICKSEFVCLHWASPPFIFRKFPSLSSQNLCLRARSKVEGQNHLLCYKHPNSCICQEKRIAFVSQAEFSFSPVQSNEQLLLWSLSKNISLHSAHSGLLCLLFPLFCSLSKC